MIQKKFNDLDNSESKSDWDDIETKRTNSTTTLCFPHCKICIIGLVIGSLMAGIVLATVLTMWLKPISNSTSTTTSTTTTTTSTTSTTTIVTSTTSTTTSTSTTSTSSSSSTSTSSTSTSTTSTSTSTSTTSTTATTTIDTTTLDALYIPSTSTCSSTLVTPCTTTTTLIANCQSYEVQWNNHCYYLDGTNGTCTTGYTLGTNAILNCIATQFAGKTYRNDISNNCCVWSADTYQCYGFAVGCNSPGPFTVGPTVSGAGCTNLQLRNSLQLSFCGSI